MYEEYYKLIEDRKDKQFNFLLGGRNVGKKAFINEIYFMKTGRRLTPMTQQEFDYYHEVTQQRVESLHEGDKLREDMLIDTIYRLSDMVEYLQKGDKN